jgi:hypothetical protein
MPERHEYQPQPPDANLDDEETVNIIRLNPDYRGLVEDKLRGYYARLDKAHSPMSTQMDTLYKIEVAKALLHSPTGAITDQDTRAAVGEHFKEIDPQLFRRAFEVIQDYAMNGGVNTGKSSQATLRK